MFRGCFLGSFTDHFKWLLAGRWLFEWLLTLFLIFLSWFLEVSIRRLTGSWNLFLGLPLSLLVRWLLVLFLEVWNLMELLRRLSALLTLLWFLWFLWAGLNISFSQEVLECIFNVGDLGCRFVHRKQIWIVIFALKNSIVYCRDWSLTSEALVLVRWLAALELLLMIVFRWISVSVLSIVAVLWRSLWISLLLSLAERKRNNTVVILVINFIHQL